MSGTGCWGVAAVLLLAAPAVRGGEFEEFCKARAEAAEKAGQMSVAGGEGWSFLARELRHLGVGPFWGADAARVSRADKPENADPLPAIVDFAGQMKKAGIELLVVPVPAKAVVYADKLDARFAARPRRDEADARFIAELRANGVAVLDLTDEFLARRDEADGAMFCRTDSHWSGRACEAAARRIAAEVKDRPWLEAAARQAFKTETRQVTVEGDLVRGGAGGGGAETLPLRVVTTADGQPVEPSRESPVVLLGDSHCLVFHAGDDMLATGAGLADQLAVELGMAVDLIGVRGSGATPARINLLRQARANPDYLAKKKLVLWCFTVREFTESSGWSKVPVVK